MTHKWNRKMIPSSILLVLIFISHIAIGTYEYNHKPKWNGINHNQQHEITAHQALEISHRQHRHHHHETMHKNNREMHIISKQNETDEITMFKAKHRSTNSDRGFVLPNRVSMNYFDTPTTYSKAEDNTKQSWPHYNRQSHQDNQQLKEHSSSSQDQKTQRFVFEKKSRFDTNDPSKISFEDQRPKSGTEYDDDYDDYYEETDENESQIEERGDNTETVDEISDYNMLHKSYSKKEDVKSNEGPDRDDNSQQDQDSYYNSDGYSNDEPDPYNDERNQNVSVNDMKWNKLGTPNAVAKTREQFLYIKNRVTEHLDRIKEEVKCRWPHPKIIQVIEASNRFHPHCTILHRCGDDTGCCSNDTQTCVAKTSNSVDLYFYIIPFDKTLKPSVGYRTFDNHTECKCIEKNRFRRAPRHKSFPRLSNSATSGESCRCPGHFYAIKERSHCRCDCLSWNQECWDLKEGRDRFSYKDQKCILENKCQKPSCEFGHYNKHSGRCPKPSTMTTRINYR